MADEFLTDDQQADIVRGWLRENGLFLAGGVLLGLGALFGWQQWQNYQEQRAVDASALFENMAAAVRGNRVDEAQAMLGDLSAQYGDLPYIDQARLLMARLHLDGGRTDAAVEELETVMNDGGTPDIQRLARLRLARVRIYQEQHDTALSLLRGPASPAFEAVFHEVRGDAYYAMDKFPEARSEYEQALAAADEGAILDRNIVQAKLDDLGLEPPVSADVEPAPAGG